MKTEHTAMRPSRARPLFCLALVAALLAGLFTLNGVAASPSSAEYDVNIVSCSTHTAAVSGGDLYLWGTNDSGQFPNSETLYSPDPIKLLGNVKDVAVAPGRTFVLDSAGRLTVYGSDPRTGQQLTPSGARLTSGVAQIAASGSNYAYVTNSGALYTAGYNDCGQLGDGTTADSSEPVKALDSGAAQVSLGQDFALALMKDGSLYGWGNNINLQLGYTGEDGEVPDSLPTPTLLMEDVKAISAGNSYSCILKKDGTLWTCGSNDLNQTGTAVELSTLKEEEGEDDEETAKEALRAFSSPLTKILDHVRSVATGAFHSFAITEDGKVYTWGYGLTGQLGDAELTRAETPVETSLEFVQVFSGDSSCFGISPDGSIYSWGSNTNYQLAKSNGADSLSPVRVLDADMNWVYNESAEPDHGASQPDAGEDESSGTTSSPVEQPEEPEVPEEPELVSTPFINGNGDGTFSPGKAITRAEFLKMTVTALCDYNDATDYGASSFSDIPLNQWFENYVAYAEINHIVGGYDDGTFHPNAPISRAEATKMAAVAMGLKTEDAPDAGFHDVSGWAVPYINAFAQTGALQGDGNGAFQPDRNITRAEAAKIIAAATGFQPEADEIEALTQGVKNPFTDVRESEWYYVYILRAAGLVK